LLKAKTDIFTMKTHKTMLKNQFVFSYPWGDQDILNPAMPVYQKSF